MLNDESRKQWVSVARWRRRPGTAGAYFIFHNTEHGDALGGPAAVNKVLLSLVYFGPVAGIWTFFFTSLSTAWLREDDMSAQGLLSTVFSCSLSPKSISKRRLRQTRSLDSALMRHCGTEAEETSRKVSWPYRQIWMAPQIKANRLFGVLPLVLEVLEEFTGSDDVCRLYWCELFLILRFFLVNFGAASLRKFGIACIWN